MLDTPEFGVGHPFKYQNLNQATIPDKVGKEAYHDVFDESVCG